MANSKRGLILHIFQTLMLTIVQSSYGSEQAFVKQIKEKIETARAEKVALLKWKQEKQDQLAALSNQKFEGSGEYQNIQLLFEAANQKIRAIDEIIDEKERSLFFTYRSTFNEPRLIITINHKDHIRAVAWSPDGSKIATGSCDNTAQVWGIANNKQIAAIQHKDWVNTVAWSPDGSKIATASSDHTAQVWDITNKRLIATIQHEDGVNAVAWSPDGSKIATASNDNSAQVWDISTNKLVVTIQHQGSVYTVAWSPDGTKSATGSIDGTAQVWDISTNKLVFTIQHKKAVNAVAWTPDGSRIATGSWDGTAQIRDIANNKLVNINEPHPEASFGVSRAISLPSINLIALF